VANPDSRSSWVLSLSEVRRDDVDLAGGKGANLGELIHAGVRVPPGFVVTTRAYTAAARDAFAADVSPEPGRRRQLLEAVGVPAEVEVAIRSGYLALSEGPVAVRSSATAEDLPGAAFAGQQDTFLDVTGPEAVLDAIRRCWASLWTERAIAYRDHRHLDHDQVRIAVVVQRMVPAEAAGVLFTANPLTGARSETVIDASPGLGEAVVSGTVSPDHLVLDHPGPIHQPLTGAFALLGTGPVAELAATGARIAALFGRPQDVEWAFAEHAVWIVQARPMTALPPEPLELGRVRRQYATILAELLPVRPYPLDMTTWTVRGHGRILTRMMSEIPALRIDLRQVLPEFGDVVQQLVPPVPKPTVRTFLTPLRMRHRIARFHTRDWMDDPRFVTFDRSVEELRHIDPQAVSWPDLLDVPGRAFDALDDFITLRIDYLPGVGASLLRLRLLLAVLHLGRNFGGLTLGGHTRTDDANVALRELAEQVRAERTWRAAFSELSVDELARTIVDEDTFAELREAIGAYADEYGHRETTSAFVMSEPTVGEDPRTILGMVKALAEHPEPARTSAATGELSERRMLRSRQVQLTHTGPRLAAAIGAARSGVAFREDSHFHASRVLPIVRASLLEVGVRLARAGVLDQPLDVLHLRFDEITRLGDLDTVSRLKADRLRAVVRERSERRAELAGAPLISPLTLHPKADTSAALVAGTGTGGGVASGPVRVILGADQFGQLQPGDVLVCPYTNPSWTPLFGTAAAAVVDTGGMASHAAIVAREYGIPAVMGTGNGTRALRDGQIVEVDGNHGQVRPVG